MLRFYIGLTLTASALLAQAPSGSLASVFATHLSATIAAADTPTTSYVLPQLAFGGGWYTAVYFANISNQATSVSVKFVGDDGTALNVPGIGTSTTVNLAAQGSAILEALDTGAAVIQGSVVVALPSNVSAYGVFRQSVPGRDDQEAVVPLSKLTDTNNTLIWDDTSHTTAVAIVNPSATPVTVNINVWNADGSSLGTATIPLAAGAKTATVLRDLPGLSGMAGKMGQADFTVSSGNVAVLGLRFGGSAFTSIPTTEQ
jgi:hypothetical protein